MFPQIYCNSVSNLMKSDINRIQYLNGNYGCPTTQRFIDYLWNLRKEQMTCDNKFRLITIY